MAYKNYRKAATTRRFGYGRKRKLDMSPAAKDRRKQYKRKMRNPMYKRKVQLARKKYYRRNKVQIRRRNKLYRQRMKRFKR